MKLSSTGLVAWQKTYGNASFLGNDATADAVYSVQQTSDAGFILAGYTEQVSTGGTDFWVLKLNSTGSIVWNKGSVASTQTTNAVPSDSTASASATSAVPASSAATIQDTHVPPRGTHATVTVQSESIPPATIIDLAAGSSMYTSINLTWTAPGDDGMSGIAAGNVLKCSTSGPITDSNWGTATIYNQSWTPAKNGTLRVTLSPV